MLYRFHFVQARTGQGRRGGTDADGRWPLHAGGGAGTEPRPSGIGLGAGGGPIPPVLRWDPLLHVVYGFLDRLLGPARPGVPPCRHLTGRGAALRAAPAPSFLAAQGRYAQPCYPRRLPRNRHKRRIADWMRAQRGYIQDVCLIAG